eukprot:1326242-Pyramimonas_sp.AAC.1
MTGGTGIEKKDTQCAVAGKNTGRDRARSPYMFLLKDARTMSARQGGRKQRQARRSGDAGVSDCKWGIIGQLMRGLGGLSRE